MANAFRNRNRLKRLEARVTENERINTLNDLAVARVADDVAAGYMLVATYDGAGVSEQLVGLSASQTLTNKTLTTPVISSISNSGTVTFPTGTRTLVARDTTDTLTNKTLTTPKLSTSTVSGLPGSPALGMISIVTDANATTQNSVVAGSGSNTVLVFYDGTNWRIA